MRVLFSNPPWWVHTVKVQDPNGGARNIWKGGVRAGSRWPFTLLTPSSPDHFQFGSYLPYPMFMGYAATYVAAKTSAEVVFRDSIALGESYTSFVEFVFKGRFDYIFIESATPSWEHDSELIKALKRGLPDLKFVLTGPIATKRQQLFSEVPIHACILGEYEKGSVKVIEGAEGVIDFDLLSKEEMNQAPFPYMDSVIAHRYWDACPKGQTAPQAQVWSSRGCPYKCIFCVWPATMTSNDPDGTSTRSVRHYTGEYMEAYLGELVSKYKYRTIYFDDDTFNLGNAHTLRMCEVMGKLGVPWAAMCRADTIQMETWRAMREAGCFGVKLGFESGNQQVVDLIVNKRLDLERARQVVMEVKRLGMTVHGTFTYGLPGETAAQMADTKKFIASLPFDTIQESGTAEIEGTPLHSLTTSGKLDAYKGAHIDSDYIRDSNGARKMYSMAEQLRNG